MNSQSNENPRDTRNIACARASTRREAVDLSESLDLGGSSSMSRAVHRPIILNATCVARDYCGPLNFVTCFF